MQLLIDEAYVMDSEIVEEINESGIKEKNYYIQGIFSTPNKKNRNGRIYSEKLWEDNVNKYQEHIRNNTIHTLGEIEHPSRVDPDPMKAAMKIIELKMEDGLVKGKAKILNNNNPETNQLKALIKEGIKIGVSSRGTGKMNGSVVEEFQLSTYDIVKSPSDYNAELSGIVESIEKPVTLNENGSWICNDSGCALKEANDLKEDTKEDTKEPEKNNVQDVIENLQQYTYVPEEITETEKFLKDLIESKKPKDDRFYKLLEELNTFFEEDIDFTDIKKMYIESTNKLVVRGANAGSSFCKKIEKQDELIKAIKNRKELKNIYKQIQSEDDYSDNVTINFNNSKYDLYAKNGVLRLGAGGSNFDGCAKIKHIPDSEVIEAIEKGNI
jgi:hypothetical protein